MSDTPLSDLIGPALRETYSRARVALHDALLDAWLGVHMARVPERATPGERLELNADDDVGFGYEAMPDGRKLIKVCADPEVFRRNYPQMAFQVEMEGRELFKMILREDYFDGALICSALARDAYLIGRPMIHKLLELTPQQLAIRAAAREQVLRAESAPR